MTGIDFIRDLAVVLCVAGAVGWICQRLGLSLVVGYLAAGAIVGPHTPPVQFVADLDRVQVLAQVGLVFLIFSIGLNLSFARLRRLGVPVILATAIGAVLVFTACRLFGAIVGWSSTQSLFLAGMLMVSSSAIISKVLQELNATHRREGQLALGITVMEDVVAIVMLAVLSTLIQFGGERTPPIAQIVGGLSAFVVLLVLSAVFFIPRLLLRLTQPGRTEIRTIIVLGLLLFLAWLAQIAGYSMALGAFLLGVVVASTPQKPEIERVFEGLRDMFGAVFFVAMGMLVDFRLLISAWPLVLGVTAFAILCRSMATSVGLLLAGNQTREAVRAGLALTPLGEFSFIIAQMGVAAAVVPKNFFPVAVGASLLTTLIAPTLMRRSDRISTCIDHRLPLVLREWIAFYHSWLDQLVNRRQRSALWKLTSRRVLQVIAAMFLISALVLLVRPLFALMQQEVGDNWVFSNGTSIIFWAVFGGLVLGPLVAIWRNIEVLSMIIAESVTTGVRRRASLQPLLQQAIRAVAALVLVIWLLALLPFNRSILPAFFVMIGIVTVLAALLWRRLIYWQSRLEVELRTQLSTAIRSKDKEQPDLKRLLEERTDAWKLQAEEFVLPEFSASAGQRIGQLGLRRRLGCSIASIDRHGIIIVNPSAEVTLYPQDKLLLLGTAGQIDLAMAELGAARTLPESQDIDEFSLETISVPENSPVAGKALSELDLQSYAGVQVAGIQRGTERILTPGANMRIETGDELLILGTTKRIGEFAGWLHGNPRGDSA